MNRTPVEELERERHEGKNPMNWIFLGAAVRVFAASRPFWRRSGPNVDSNLDHGGPHDRRFDFFLADRAGGELDRRSTD